MPDHSYDIAASLDALWSRGEVRQDLYDDILKMARSTSVKHAEGRTDIVAEEPEDIAGEFLVFLAKSSPPGDMKGRAQLKREFRRWLTRRNDPSGSELWHILSDALRTLEQDGVVQRAAQHRGRNNSNETEWSLPPYAGALGDPTAAEHQDGTIPTYGKGRETDRLLKPKDARSLVCAILEVFRGRVTMREIVDVARRHVLLPQTPQSLDEASPLGDGEEKTSGLHESLELEASYAVDWLICQEADSRAKGIWDALLPVCRGAARTEATRVLCCYFLPKRLANQDVTLESMGPTSTINDIVHRDILPTFKTFLAREHSGSAPSQQYEKWAFRRVFSEVLERLVTFCSENGYCPAF